MSPFFFLSRSWGPKGGQNAEKTINLGKNQELNGPASDFSPNLHVRCYGNEFSFPTGACFEKKTKKMSLADQIVFTDTDFLMVKCLKGDSNGALIASIAPDVCT